MNCPTCNRPATFVRDRNFADGSGLVFTCANEHCYAFNLYFYPKPGHFDHRWFWRNRLPHRKCQLCHVLVRGGKNSIMVEFPDGQKCVTSRYAVRKIK